MGMESHASGHRVLDPHVVVLFGATGDLARRKLLPGMFHLMQSGLLPDFRVVGTSLDDLDDEGFRHHARSACQEFARGGVNGAWDEFVSRLSFVRTTDGADGLRKKVEVAADALRGDAVDSEVRYLHYLSVPPSAAGVVVQSLSQAGLVENARIIMEKPFGTDLTSARALNNEVHQVFAENQIFRIDHFLGKEAAQNILAFRFANGLFEPIWNRDHIDHVQIDVPETLGVENRASFYEQTGAFRDMVVTHLFQILAFTAMEPPTALEPEAIMEEKQKVFRSMRPLKVENVVRGQYEGYCLTPGVAPDSNTETFVALRCEIDNWRWAGVPFFLRTGKRMAEGARIISIAFREPPRSMFPLGAGASGPDHLTFDLQEEFRVSLSFYGKKPGPGMQLYKSSLQFSLGESGHESDALEAYERLIHDAMLGDHTLFNSAAGVERVWEVSAPLLENPPEPQLYRQGTWGPLAVRDLIAPYRWRLPFERQWRSHN
jgi:glucose-6-phosphate 1-dehydrogenase